MGQFKLGITALGAAVFLAACGGGGGDAPSISGLAATGAALTNASMTVKCASGDPLTASTDANGNFKVSLNGGQTMPCLVQVTKGNITLHSFSTAPGRLNVTPLTDLVVTKALGADPVDAFSNFDSVKGAAIVAGLAAAKTYMAGQLAAMTLNPLAGDPLTGTFVVGGADDLVLDAFKVKMDTAGLSFENRRQIVIAVQTFLNGLAASAARGTVVGAPAVAYTYNMATLNGMPFAPLTGAAKCDVQVVPLTYNTIGVKAEAATATGVMLLPSGADPACTASKTLVAYSKGTDVKKNRLLSTQWDGESLLLAAMYAAQGHAVVATDYLGFGGSNYGYHPYLHANSEASAIVDVIRAGRAAATTLGGANLSGKVMVTGYSQGGHASMAAQRAIEKYHASEINLVLGAHLSGPYNLAASFREPDVVVVNGQSTSTVVAGIQFFLPYIVTSWQKIYGGMYTDLSTVFKAPYNGAYIESLLPSNDATYTNLITNGHLPGVPGETPAQTRDRLFQSAFLTDMNTNLNNPVYLAAKKNDLMGWKPSADVLLCGGSSDPTVPYALHSDAALADLNSRAAGKTSLVNVNDSVFAAYGASLMSGDPVVKATAWGKYHGEYVPPLCAKQARNKLDAVLAALAP